MVVVSTPAIRWLSRHGLAPDLLEYQFDKGTAAAASRLGVPEHSVVKTLVFCDEFAEPLLALMHGDLRVSVRKLERVSTRRRLFPASPEFVHQVTGYLPGGVSPFGLPRSIPVFIQSTLAAEPALVLNAGRRGLVMKIEPAVLNLLEGCWTDFSAKPSRHCLNT